MISTGMRHSARSKSIYFFGHRRALFSTNALIIMVFLALLGIVSYLSGARNRNRTGTPLMQESDGF